MLEYQGSAVVCIAYNTKSIPPKKKHVEIVHTQLIPDEHQQNCGYVQQDIAFRAFSQMILQMMRTAKNA